MKFEVKRFAQIGLFLLSFSLVWSNASLAAYLESDQTKTIEDPTPRPPRVIPPPRPVPPIRTHPLHNLIRRIEVGDPQHYRGVSVYPLRLARPSSHGSIRTLDEALSRDWITIQELEHARVSSLRIRNNSRHHVFLMSGEVILGGKQNRIVRSDVLLPPESRFIDVPVYCGEQERWTTSTGHFKKSPGIANQSLRKMAARSSSQEAVWSEIDSQLSGAKVSSPTRDYRVIHEDREVKSRVDDYVRKFRPIWRSRAVGAVVVVGGAIRNADVFSDPVLFEKLRDKICRSYAMDVIVKPIPYSREKSSRYVPGKQQVRNYLNRVLSARMSEAHTSGAGRLYRFSGHPEGETLTWRDQVVHAALFPASYHIQPR